MKYSEFLNPACGFHKLVREGTSKNYIAFHIQLLQHDNWV